MSKKYNHFYKEDVCIHCGLRRRKKQPLTPNLRFYGVGKWFYEYLVDGKWTSIVPDCIKKKRSKS